MNLNTLINNNKNQFDRQYKRLLKSNLDNSILSKSMYYGSINGGKRIRPFLVNIASDINKVSKHNTFIIAACIESIHSYSLIHDDLPCMDDDDYRRGKLSTHKKYDEATAILAGDALHDFAFQLLSESLTKISKEKNLQLINYLTLCTGYSGLAGGQSLDLLYENKKLSKKKIIEMYSKKTGKLFEFSFAAPFIIKGETNNRIKFSKSYGALFGTIFQIMDDLFDEVNSFKEIGKTPGKDKKQGKRTLLSIIGKKNTINFCEENIYNFIKKNKNEFKKNPILKELLYFNIKRLN